ncbi:golgin subfamily B member 1-like isoform X5 [Biomphalaria glabrata]|uniref:Golgin subfamily B member 1-like isoform X5 n=1 Tax=Biomphalaria glabrata TaxID=6526 RepID=A0A9W3B9S5_BIOGL|nr:golgin subfamily B member 1-like isoform X5 [Biomphalaria glabrata]
MDRTAEMSSLPLDFDGSLDPAGLPEITLGNHSLMGNLDQSPHNTMSRGATGRISPIRGRTMKEYDQQISDLKKENFSLKMRIYYMEERMQQRYGDGQDVFKTNIELQVEIDNLKRDLQDKQVLVQKAAVAMKTLTDNHEQTVETMKNRVLAEHQGEMNRLKEQAENASKDCERYRKEAEESTKRLETLKQSLDDALFELNSVSKAKEDMSNKVKRVEFEVQTLTAQLKLLEQTRVEQDKERVLLLQRQKDLEQQIADSRKDSSRKDRDIMDEIEDLREAVQRKDKKLQEMDDLLKHKDHVIEKLEDALKTLRSEKTNVEKNAEDTSTELEEKVQVLAKYKRSIEGLVRTLREKDKENKVNQERLKASQSEIERLREALRKAELERTEVVTSAAESESTNKKLEVQLKEADTIAENLIKSLGKKEGELASFQEQLKKAMEALNKSEEALEALQAQLTAERADFENQLKEQALKYQMLLESKLEPKGELDHLRKQVEDLQNKIAAQGAELLSSSRDKIDIADLKNRLNSKEQEFQNLLDKHHEDMLTLTKELEALKAELRNKDKLVQAPLPSMMWDNRQYHETVHTHQIYGAGSLARLDVLGDPAELLQEIRSATDKLKEEIVLMARLNNLSEAQCARTEKETPGKDLGSVEGIHRRLEELMEKNNQLHHVMVAHLKQDNRQSDSPDSNSCQDGGYSLDSPVRDVVVVKYAKQNNGEVNRSESSSTIGSSASSPAFNHSVGVETYPDVLDKSLQTGLSFYHTDQWAQTSPRREENGNQGEDSQLSDPLPPTQISSSKDFLTGSEKLLRPDHSSYNTSSASDSVLRGEESLEDYHNFRHGISFDDYYYELCRPDRASAVLKSDSKDRRSLPHSRNSKLPEGPHQTAPQSLFPGEESSQNVEDHCAGGDCNFAEVMSDVDEPDGNGHFKDTVPVFDQGEAPDNSTYQVDLVGGGDHSALTDNRNKTKAYRCYEERLSSFVTELQNSSLKQSSVRPESTQAIDNLEEQILDHQIRRSSWAEELEQYRVTNDGLELKADNFMETVSDMSVRELRNLVAKLYRDLQEQDRFIESRVLSVEVPADHQTSFAHAENKTEDNSLLDSHSQSSKLGQLKATTSFKPFSQCNSEPADSTLGGAVAFLVSHTSVAENKEKMTELETQIQELKGQLEATENTVRLLSKKNKLYLSTLESAGLSTKQLSRSSSESCLGSEPRPSRLRATSMDSLSHQCSDQDNGHNESANITDVSVQGNENVKGSSTGHHYQNNAIQSRLQSPADYHSGTEKRIIASKSLEKESLWNSVEKARFENALSNDWQSINLTQLSSTVMSTERTQPASSSQSSLSLDKASLQLNMNSNHHSSMDTSLFNGMPLQQMSETRPGQAVSSTAQKASDQFTLMEEGHSQTKTELSLIDQSLCPDVTYSSILDYTSLARSMSLLDNKSQEGEENKTWKNLSVVQLRLRLEHLEQVNATLKEEIAVFEALHNSAGVQTSLSDDGPRKTEKRLTLTEKELLKEHLLEIRKLRQRLEKLDVTNDPDQLLIFQSHTYQRITHQDTMISMLQTQLSEREDQWQREMAETQHKLSREKAIAVEKLEQTICQLQATVLSQKDKMRELELTVRDLRSELDAQLQERIKMDEDLKKVSGEKNSLEEDLLKREREFLDLEKAMFKLEMSKENLESESRRLKLMVEESEKDRKQLKNDMEEYKECSSRLKEVVERREKSLQETLLAAQKLNTLKKELERKVSERDDYVKVLERELEDLKQQMRDNDAGLEDELNRLRKELDSKEQHWVDAETDYKVQLMKLNDEKKMINTDLDYERQTFSKHSEQMRQEKNDLEELVSQLRGKVAYWTGLGLEEKVGQLTASLEMKTKFEAELREQCHLLSRDMSETSEKLRESEGRLRKAMEEKHDMEESLKERNEKVKKREKQLHHLLNQQKKLDLAYVKLKYTLTEKEELVQSLQRRMHLCEITLNCSTQEEKEDIMRELLKELLATQRQVEDLLSRIEKNTSDSKASNTVISSSATSVVTTVTSSMTSTVSGKTELKPAEVNIDILSSSADESDYRGHPSPDLHSSLGSPGSSPGHHKLYAEAPGPLHSVSDKLPTKGADIHGLCAVLKLDAHEKLRKETNESLVTLSGLEARLNDRLRSYKSKPITESVDYSTIRESSLACHNLRVCLNEAASLVATAWVTELPPVDSLGHFYDPILAEQNDYLRHELTVTRSRMDVLNHTVKEQQDRLNATTERQKSWESSLYKQYALLSQQFGNVKLSRSVGGLVSVWNIIRFYIIFNQDEQRLGSSQRKHRLLSGRSAPTETPQLQASSQPTEVPSEET